MILSALSACTHGIIKDARVKLSPRKKQYTNNMKVNNQENQAMKSAIESSMHEFWLYDNHHQPAPVSTDDCTSLSCTRIDQEGSVDGHDTLT